MKDSPFIKHTAKDSVFTHLFGIPKNALSMSKALCPEIDATEEDIEFLTLNTVLTTKPYNDLGLLIKEQLLLLAEAQSSWSVNALLRMFMYLAETYHRYIEDHEGMNIYGSKKLELPKPACFIIYTGAKKDTPEELSLGNEFFGKDAILDLKVKVISSPGKSDIVKQYIRFCQVLNLMIKKYGRTAKAIEETIRICQDEGILTEYLNEYKKEVNTIMKSLFSQEEVTKRFAYELRQEGREEGILSSINNLMDTLNLTVDKAMDALKVPTAEREFYKKAIATGAF